MPQGYSLNAVTFGGGQFVAVGDGGTILRSPDGYSWERQAFGRYPSLSGVAYANRRYVAVGAQGTILLSSNAVTWTRVVTTNTANFFAIGATPPQENDGHIRLVVVGEGGTIVLQDDGGPWITLPPPTNDDLLSVALTDRHFVAVGRNGTAVRATGFLATDPPSVQKLLNFDSNDLLAVAYGNGRYVAGGTLLNFERDISFINFIFVLPQDSFWRPVIFRDGLLPPFYISGLAAGADKFVAVGRYALLERNHPAAVLTSDSTGDIWMQHPNTCEYELNAVTYGKERFVAVGAAGGIAVSTNGLEWRVVNPDHRSAITCIASTETLSLASAQPMVRAPDVTGAFTLLVSSNGGPWSMTVSEIPTLADLAAGQGRFVGIANECTYTTIDGNMWQTACPSPSHILRGIAYANGRFVAVGDGGGIFGSADGINWTNVSLETSASFNGVAFGDGRYVAAGSAVAVSSDGLAWSLAQTNLSFTINRVVYGNRSFVATAYTGPTSSRTGQLLSSEDGVDWQMRFELSFGDLPSVAYTGGTFLAVSTFGALLISTDGKDWKTSDGFLTDGIPVYYPGYRGPVIAVRGGNFLVGGVDGMLLESANTWDPAILESAALTGNEFSFSFRVQPDVPFRIESWTGGSEWTSVYSGLGTGKKADFKTSANGNDALRFFRIVHP